MKGLSVKKIVIALICILVAYGEIAGIYHSFNKHPKGDHLYSIFIPPWAWYRFAETWWHNDEECNDWNEKLKADTKNCLILFTQYGKGDTVEVNKAIKALKLQFNKYPNDKYDYVKNFCREYISYYRFSQKEFNQWLIKFFNDGNVHYQKSNELSTLESNISKYGVDELNRSMKHNDSLFVLLYYEYNRMKQQYRKAAPEGQKQFLEVIFRKDNINLQNIKMAYKNIFNEEIK